MVKIRIAKIDDAASILKIYTPHVLQSAITFETVVPSVEDFEGRIAKCLQRFPWAVCEVDHEIAGYVYASTHREREAYQWTCECSVYVAEQFKGKGIGTTLYKTLFQILQQQGLVNLYAGITLPNEASVRLHENCGFVKFAEYDKIGYKLDTWHQVGWWKFRLNKHQLKPSPPLLFSDFPPLHFAGLFEQAASVFKEKLRS